MATFLRKVTSWGVSQATSKSEMRNVILANYISLVIATAPLLLAFSVALSYNSSIEVVGRLLGSTLLFLLPLLFNRLGYTVLSRILLCWIPPIVVFSVSILDLYAGDKMSEASFVGLRMYLNVCFCFPFLVFNLKDAFKLLLGLSVTVFSLFFFDEIFFFFGVGYLQNGIYDPLYEFNNVRSLVSSIGIGGSLYFLKRVVERNERINEKLLAIVEEKNVLLQKQAKDDVLKLNQQLTKNVQQLSEREFILSQSQRIAKIGSWEYDIKNGFTFWSEEMYNIFGLDHDYDLKTKNLSKVMLQEESQVLIVAAKQLLRTHEPFDITLRIRNPVGYVKWVRIYAFPRLHKLHIAGMRGICHDITFYKEAEDLLRTSENKYRSLFEQASDFIAILDFAGNFIDVNISFCTAFGYTRQELLSMKIEALIDPEELPGRPIKYEELNRGEHVFSHRRMMRRDRSIVDVESNVKKIQEDRMLVIARDVTKLREVQKQIQLSEAKFRGAFECSAIGMALVSLDARWLQVNKELCSIVGYPEEELLMISVKDITLPADAEEDFLLQRHLIEGNIEIFQREKRYIHKDGSIIWVHVNVSLIKDNFGIPLYLVAQIEDITQEKLAAEKLIVNEANLKATINNTELLIWSVDKDLKLLMFNKQCFDFVKAHYGTELKTGAEFFEGYHTKATDEYNIKWKGHYAEVLAGESLIFEGSAFDMDFQFSLSPIMEGDQAIGVSVFADNVTERKARDRELSEANKKIGELRLMALRSVMSPHFIFNVLNSIQFFIARNDRLNAINYLSTFSKLVRSILTHSVDNKINLSEEIEMLKNYVHLEMTRFENKFTFALTVEPGIETESITIPSLLIQPYVENAIIHGLYNKLGTGTLEIRIKEKNGVLFFEIEDNGVGRDAAMKLRRQSFPAHKSMGIKITEERLKLINQGHETAFEIDDLTGSDGPSGTLVRIGIRI